MFAGFRRWLPAFAAAVLAAATLAGCATNPGDTAMTTAAGRVEDVPLIPREVLFGNPERAAARISPDGARLSYLAPVDGVMNVWVGPVDDPDAAQPVTKDTDRGIRVYFWAYTSQHLLYLQDKDGDENWRVYKVDLETGAIDDLTPLEGVRAEIEGVSHRFPNEIIVGLNDRDPRLHDLYRVSLQTGQRELVLENPGFSGFVVDDDYRVRLGVQSTPDGGRAYLRPVDGGWETFIDVGMDDSLTTYPIGFTEDGGDIYLADSRGRDTAALTLLDPETGAQTVLAEDEKADLADVLMHPTENTVQAAAFTYTRKEWDVLEPGVAGDLAFLEAAHPGDVEVVSRTLDDAVWVVAYLQDDGPVRYYLYRREADPGEALRFLFVNQPALAEQPLVPMHPVVIEARDGLSLVSYLTLPPGSSPGDGLTPAEPLPMVLAVHGGPWARSSWGYDPVAQWLANRGYAVLDVNFRGSTGFGKAFLNAGNKEWAAKMHDDLIDAVDWAVGRGIADPDRVAIYGGSYGGYAALVGLTFTPETFACAVDIVGPSSLITLLNSIPPYWEPMIELFTTRVGDHRTEEGRAFLESRSPLTYVERIERPLLIGQGANDPRVKQAESDQIVAAMQEKDIPVTYVLYPDEGHGFARPENRLSFYAVTEGFLQQSLGGRREPVGDDFEDSTIQVPAGAAYVPGLQDALASVPPEAPAE